MQSMNICNKCKVAKYCNAACKKNHRHKHKANCNEFVKRAAELHDEALFQDHPPTDDCPICFLPLPIEKEHSAYYPCCGKYVCMGCIHAMVMEGVRKGKTKEEVGMCPYCRAPPQDSVEGQVKQYKNLMEKGNAMAYYQFGGNYAQGRLGLTQDWVNANELWLKAGDLGCAEAYFWLGYSYDYGRGAEADKKKGKHYYELAAKRGNVIARHNLGLLEGKAGNHERAMKHFMVAARAGDNESLDKVKQGFRIGHVTKDEYAGTLRAYHESQTEMKSEARDKAADFQARRAALNDNISERQKGKTF